MIIFLSASFGRRFLKHYVFLFFWLSKTFTFHGIWQPQFIGWILLVVASLSTHKQSIFASLVAKIEDPGPQPKALKKYTRHWNRLPSRRLFKGCFFDEFHQATSDFLSEMKGFFFTKTSMSQGLACIFRQVKGCFG